MSFATHLECSRCGTRAAIESTPGLCSCGGPFLVRYDLATLRGKDLRHEFSSRPAGLWRYRELLPVRDDASLVTLGEGGTPLLASTRLVEKLGAPSLYLKDESLNPTGTFKARGFSVAVSMAVELGLKRLALATAGNAGGALAAYTARCGLQASVIMPENSPRANLLECRFYGAELELIPGTIRECGLRLKEKIGSGEWFDVSTFREPYRVEGKKTMAYEFFEQLGGRLPEAVIYPAGGGTGLVAMWKAFEEMEALGWIGPGRPKMVAVQASGCAPLVRAFDQGAEQAEPWANPSTEASGLCVPRSLADFLILRLLRESKGKAVAVEEAEIQQAVREIAATEGLLIAPEAAAAYAGYKRLLEEKFLERNESVVVFLTGSGYKYLDQFGSWSVE